jgi:hypothetical protein
MIWLCVEGVDNQVIMWVHVLNRLNLFVFIVWVSMGRLIALVIHALFAINKVIWAK